MSDLRDNADLTRIPVPDLIDLTRADKYICAQAYLLSGNKEFLEKIDRIEKRISAQKKKKMTEKISANVNLAKNLLIRIIPLFIKKRIMSLVENRVGDGYVTTTLSNIGLVKLPKEMEQYITDINFILGKSKGKSGSISAVGYQDTLYITFSRKIKEVELERLFFTKLVKMGLEVEIESNR